MPNTNSNKFAYAQSLLTEKKFRDAAIIFEKIKKNYNKDANYWFMLGICYASTGDYRIAEKHFLKAVKLSPGAAQAWSNLGLAQLHQKRYKTAITSFKRSVAIDSNFFDALCNLSLAYLYTNNISKAIEICKQAININSSNAQAHNILGLCYQKSDINKSISSFRTSISLNPDLYDAYHNIVDTYILYNDYDNAENAIKTIPDKFINKVDIYLKLGKIYEQKKLFDKAIATYLQGLSIQADNIDLLTSAGKVYIIESKFDEGLTYLDKALSINPNHQDAILEKSTHYILIREYMNAYNLLEKLVNTAGESIKPKALIAYANACRLAGITKKGLEPLQNLTRKSLPSNVLATAQYTLGDIYDDIGEYDNAFRSYKHANDLRYLDTDINYYCDVFLSIKDNLNASTLETLPHSSNTTDTPVFIVGMPRSGTTLIEQILSSHPDVYGAGEITNLWSVGNKIAGAMNLINYTSNLLNITNDEISQYSTEYIKYIAGISNNAKRCTDKLPHNFFHIGLIELLFPKATIIHCTRNPLDNCLSIYFKDFNDNHKYARNLNDLALFYKEYMKLMEHWSNNSRLMIHHVQYESLVNNPDEEIRSLIDATGLDWNDACLKHHNSRRTIMTPSYSQASRPIYTDSVHRWKNYANHITPLIDILGK